MKNPKSNYIADARRIRRNRLIIRGIIIGVVTLVVGFSLFFAYILNLKKDIDSEFSGSDSTPTRIPSTEDTESSGDSTSEMTTTPPSEETSETTPEDTSSEETSETGETGDTSETEETAIETNNTEDVTPTDENGNPIPETTTISLLPDEPEERDPVLFPEKYPLQTVTHAQRDQSYANMKHAVKKYVEEKTGARIGFYYINLRTSEAFGYNESSPFVVGSSIYLPLSMLYYDDVRAGTQSPITVVPFHPSYVEEGTFSNLSDMPDEKQFYMGQLVYLALRDGDGVAMNMLLDHMGGADNVISRLTGMTTCIDYATVQNYVDFQGIQQSGEHRSSAYDLASYAEVLYWKYMSYPQDYQELINALGESDPHSGVGKGFPSDTLILHRGGKNLDFNSAADVAIILSDEPVIIAVTVEASTPEETQEIQSALGALVYNFISYCHA